VQDGAIWVGDGTRSIEVAPVPLLSASAE
jgi:hypothetical protein